MARKLDLPFPPLIVINQGKATDWAALGPQIEARLPAGVSICITADKGHKTRGGYYFHLKNDGNGIALYSFDAAHVTTLESPEQCMALINHMTGYAYDERMWILCQTLNLRTDPP